MLGREIEGNTVHAIDNDPVRRIEIGSGGNGAVGVDDGGLRGIIFREDRSWLVSLLRMRDGHVLQSQARIDRQPAINLPPVLDIRGNDPVMDIWTRSGTC